MPRARSASTQSYAVPARTWSQLAVSRSLTQNDRTMLGLTVDLSTVAGDFAYLDAATISAGSAVVSFNEINLNDPASGAWEEVYGAEYSLTPLEVPVVANGLCRVIYVATNAAYKLEAWINGAYTEIGRVTIWQEDTSGGTGVEQHRVVRSVAISEWTQDRAVIQVVTGVAANANARMTTYLTLQRGWTAPRIEAYASPRGTVKVGVHIRFSPASTLAGNGYAGYNAGAYDFNLPSTDGTWGTATMVSFAASREPWAALSGPHKTVAMAVLLQSNRIRTHNDTEAYTATRKALTVCSEQGSAAVGWCSVRYGFAAVGAPGTDGSGAFTGVRDLGFENLYDARQIPELVGR